MAGRNHNGVFLKQQRIRTRVVSWGFQLTISNNLEVTLCFVAF